MTSEFRRTVLRCAAMALMVAVSGCASSSAKHHLEAVPAHRVPAKMLSRSRQDMQQISLARLRRTPPEEYRLAEKDVLGIYVESILGQPDEPPPVHFPEDGSREPAIGYPIPIREDGTIALPLIPPIQAVGLTITELTQVIERGYTLDRQILPPGKNRIIVTLMRRHAERVLVIREEAGGPVQTADHHGSTKRGAGYIVDLPAGENDLLHALNQTGGLPGLDAKNEVLILRGDQVDAVSYDQLVSQIKQCREPCSCPPAIPDAPGVVRVPLRFYPDKSPCFSEEDITLNTGDIVLIESRDQEKFYTGGALGGGEFAIPRDYDLDVLQAIAVARGQVGSSGAVLSQVVRSGYGSGQGSGPLPPTKAIIVRKLSNGGQIPIQVDLKQALADPRQRVLIQPEDVLIVRYKCSEEVINTLLSVVQFNFLFNGFTGNGF